MSCSTHWVPLWNLLCLHQRLLSQNLPRHSKAAKPPLLVLCNVLIARNHSFHHPTITSIFSFKEALSLKNNSQESHPACHAPKTGHVTSTVLGILPSLGRKPIVLYLIASLDLHLNKTNMTINNVNPDLSDLCNYIAY